MYIVVFFLLLWVLFQAILCEVTCPTDTLFIMETEDNIHKDLNWIFIKILNSPNSKNDFKVPLIKIIHIKSSSNSLLRTIEDTMQLSDSRFVINLYVEDFYKYNYNDVLNQGFVWAGDIGEGKKIPVCRSNDTVLKDGMETCNKDYETQKHVKLVSSKVMSLETIYNFTIHFQQLVPPLPTPTSVNHIILVCTKSKLNLFEYNRKLKFDYGVKNIKYHSSTNCNYEFDTKFRNVTIAVIAESPKWIPETNTPVIFYDEPYAYPEDTAFYNNSIWRMHSVEPLADTFVKFIGQMNWQRVAVLSDDAIESNEFEKELRKLLEKESVAYAVHKVKETDHQYNFTKALSFFKKTKARIVIANVVEPLAKELSQQAKRYGMTISGGVQWVARDWSEATAEEAAKNVFSVFSISPSRTSITMHIESIKRVIDENSCNKHYEYLNQTKFAEDIREKHKWSDKTHMYITETKYRSQKLIHSTIATYKNGVGTFHKVLPYIPDRKDKCNFKSVNYNNPCDDMNVIFIMLVIMVTSVTILGITYFFQTPDTPYNRMP